MQGRLHRIEQLARQHNRKAFCCGVLALDTYLKQQAGQDQRRDLTRVYLLIANPLFGGVERIVGYYTLSMTAISSTSLPPEIVNGLAKYPTYPAILIGRLAVDQEYQGQEYGELLLADALQRSLEAAKPVAAMAVIVKAKDDRAAGFYEHFDFVRFVDDRSHLYLLMSTLLQTQLLLNTNISPLTR